VADYFRRFMLCRIVFCDNIIQALLGKVLGPPLGIRMFPDFHHCDPLSHAASFTFIFSWLSLLFLLSALRSPLPLRSRFASHVIRHARFFLPNGSGEIDNLNG
jgi:hypothetical protein